MGFPVLPDAIIAKVMCQETVPATGIMIGAAELTPDARCDNKDSNVIYIVGNQQYVVDEEACHGNFKGSR